MIKTDDLYLENLKELLYDDKKIVTYKFLSVFLGVHVNLAKQMLYTFYEKEKKNNKKLFALFYLSGLVREKGIGAADSDSPVEESEKQVVMLCRDGDYPEIMKKFEKLYSVHIYCLSADRIPDASVLSPLLGDTVKLGGKETSVVDYGPFSLNAEVKPLKAFLPVAKVPQPVVVKKEESKASKSTDSTSKSTDSASKSTDSSSKSTGKASKAASTGKDEAKTKHFFASQASNNGTKSKSPSKNNSTKSKTEASQSSLAASFSKTKPPKPKEKIEKKQEKKEVKKKFKSTQGRKRIRIESDSGSDDDDDRTAKKHHSEFSSSDDDSDSEERSHPFRIDSDPEEEAEVEEVEQEKSQSVEEEHNNKLSHKATCRDGRKRTLKTVVKTYEDEDGFVVTEKKQEFVSESEGEGEVPMEIDLTTTKSNTSRSKAGEEVAKAGAQKEPSASNNNDEEATKKKPKKAAASAAAKGNGTAGSSQPKSKQASIMSFFHKKS